jgi:serine/threonine-protein kinase
VIHRDIKPENILLHDGRPMVADFGIALAVSAAAGGRMTETGLSLGTPHYMSPEQATAEKEITARSDVYSLGSVLYEMLTGSPPHTGASAQQIIMKIVTEEAAPVTKLRKAVPPNVAAALAKSLEKLPADRFDSAKAFAEALSNSGFTATLAHAPGGAAVVSIRRSGLIAGVGLGAAVAVGLAVWGWLRPLPVGPVIRYRLALPPGQEPQPGSSNVAAAAPDGSFILYKGPVPGATGQQLWLKRRDSDEATPVAGTIAISSFAIAPDGRSVAIENGGALRIVPLAGSVPVTVVADSVVPGFGIAWLDDGTIVFAARGSGVFPALRRVPANGGAAEVVEQSDSTGAIDPVALPGGRGVLYTRCNAQLACAVRGSDVRRRTTREIVPGAGAAQYAPSGHLVYLANGGLVARPFDVDRLEATGEPVLLTDRATAFSLSPSGTLLLVSGATAGGAGFQLVWVDRAGRQTLVDSAWTFRLTNFAANTGWALSPDDTRLAIGLYTDAGDDIWIKPLPRGPASRVTYERAPDFRPRWARDGRSVIFGSQRSLGNVYAHRADGTGTTDTLLAAVDMTVSEVALSPDGRWLLMRTGGAAGPGGRDIVGVRLGVDTTPVPLVATRFDEEAIAMSPDGRWLAYQSDETGITEVFIRPFPEVDQGKWQVSGGGATAPLWSRDGRELFYLSQSNDMMAVRVSAGAAPVLGPPQALFRVPPEMLQVETAYYTPWDVARDGRFIMARVVETGSAAAGAVVVVENFLEELKAKVPP